MNADVRELADLLDQEFPDCLDTELVAAFVVASGYARKPF